jgi:hypothetical protein
VVGTSYRDFGVRAESREYIGVYGKSGQFGQTIGYIGVYGDSQGGGTGVFGSGGDIGVQGGGGAATGVAGEGRDWGVYGSARAPGAVGVAGEGGYRGVKGSAPARDAIGVEGEGGFRGVKGIAAARGGIGVEGDGGFNGVGVLGRGIVDLAGLFIGDVRVVGALHVTGLLTATPGNKAAVVPHPDGTERVLRSLESPESWFEDFGRAEVIEGVARVELDNDFAAVIRTDDYHVYVTPEGESSGLYVSARTPREFEVREQGGGTSTLSFSYRVVARPEGVEPDRLAVFEPASEVAPPEKPAEEPPEPKPPDLKPPELRGSR